MGDNKIGCVFFHFFFKEGLTCVLSILNESYLLDVAKTNPKLKSRYKNHVKSALDYARTIDDFDELIDPKTLSCHFLGPESSPYILRAIAKEEKSKFMMFIVFILLLLNLLFCILFMAFFYRDDEEV